MERKDDVQSYTYAHINMRKHTLTPIQLCAKSFIDWSTQPTRIYPPSFQLFFLHHTSSACTLGGGCLLFCLSKSCTSTRHNLTHTHSPYTPRVMSLVCVCVLEGEGWGQRRRTLLRLVELTLLPYDRTTKPPAGWELNPPRSPSALNKHTHKPKLRHMQTSHFSSPPPFLSLFLLIYAQSDKQLEAVFLQIFKISCKKQCACFLKRLTRGIIKAERVSILTEL